MDEKLSYLRNYNEHVRLLTIDEVSRLGVHEIPNEWRKMFNQDDIQARIDLLLNVWRKNVGNELQNTISYLSEHLINIEMMDVDGSYSILYTIKIPEKTSYIMKGVILKKEKKTKN